MNLTQMTARARRLLNEGTARRFQDSDIEALLDDAWREVKTKITRVRPEEFIETWRTDLVADQEDYSRVAVNERALRILDTTTNKYVPVEPIDWVKLQEWDVLNANAPGTYRYAHVGRVYRIKPTPSVSITSGLEVEYLDLGNGIVVDSDVSTPGLEVPPCAPILHQFLVHRAVAKGFDESGESGSEAQGRALAEWSGVDDAIVSMYIDLQGEPFVPGGIR